MSKRFTLRVFRGMPSHQYWEEFELSYHRGTNVISALMDIQREPINKQGVKVEPVVWEQGCLEEVCGSCSMLVNGKPRQACSALVEPILESTGKSFITLAPFTKFPLVRDLIVDRTVMFENLKKVHGWITADEFGQGAGPKVSQARQKMMYSFATCMTCGCCLEACPQINARSKFLGPAAVGQVRLFNAHPTGKMEKQLRLRPMMEEGGIGDCGNAQNCVRVCPKNIPLTDAIAAIGRDVTLQAIEDLFSFPDRED